MDGEITFYEELGVKPDASPEEIRDAFRLYVRLLHPDQQTDPHLKEIAEKQMRKLNRVYAVLSDPASRRRYDEVLEEEFSAPVIVGSPSRGFRRFGSTLAWSAAILLSAALLIWLASDSPSGVQGHTADPNAAQAATSAATPGDIAGKALDRESQAAQIARLRSDLRAVAIERDAAILELNKLRGTAQPKAAESPQTSAVLPLEGMEPKPPVTITELPSSAPKLPGTGLAAIPRIERSAPSRKIAGFWFYAKPPEGQANKNQSLYPPEYIEATITEEGGTIYGRYRSRFVIVDRAISPDVNFTFTGTLNASLCNCQWTGAGGAHGDLTLRVTSENSLRIDWNASELGSQQGLISGTAVLTRRIE